MPPITGTLKWMKGPFIGDSECIDSMYFCMSGLWNFLILQGSSNGKRRDSHGVGVSNWWKMVEVFCPKKWTSFHFGFGYLPGERRKTVVFFFAGLKIQEAKTFSVELRPYHDPMLPKSRDDVDMRILYKGERVRWWNGDEITMNNYCTQFDWEDYIKILAICLREFWVVLPLILLFVFLFHIPWFLIDWKIMLTATAGWVQGVVLFLIKMKWNRGNHHFSRDKKEIQPPVYHLVHHFVLWTTKWGDQICNIYIYYI